MKNTKIFLSYCWADSDIADQIYDFFKEKKKIELYRDKINIQPWGSIREYMQSIGEMDYVILLISDAYLKSSNCMYEVLEVMRDRQYKGKIFPAVINTDIYNPITRVGYVRFWEEKTTKLEEELKTISLENLGSLGTELKHYRNVSLNIAEFLDVVISMNNPNIHDINVKIEENLKSKGMIDENLTERKEDILKDLEIKRKWFNEVPSDLEMNQFVKRCYEEIVTLFTEACEQYETEYQEVQVEVEKISSKTSIYKFYKNGRLVRGLKLFLGNLTGRYEMIGVSDDTFSYVGTNAWNGMYGAKVMEGELKLNAIMSLHSRGEGMSCQEVAADIWKNYVQIYLT